MGSTTKAAWYWDIIRELLAHIDNVGYAILGTVYKIFYAIATATIISSDVIRNFYSRIQLILGILMMFKLAMSILNIIINPDLVTDSKQGGTKIITRVVTALFMLLLVIPINLPLEETDRTNNGKALSLNSYIYDHGILFGFLYKFQDSMMRENIMGRLILGTTAGGTSSSENSDLDRELNDIDANNLSEVGRNIAAQVAKTFIRPNVKNESEPYCYTDASQVSADSDFNSSYDPDTNPCPNVRCPAEVYRSGYTDEALAASSVVSVINTKCKDSELNKKVYAFNYMPLVGLLSSALMSVIIIGFTVDIAVRAIKLAVLRLIAPIPILSYVDPKSQKDGAFGNWTKSLISTYIDLFIRLAIIYFGAFLIQSLFSSGTFAGINSGNVFVDALSTVVIIIGILIFMKQAPAFLKSALGLKGEPMSNIGLSGLLGGAAMAIGGGGAAGFAFGMMQGMNASSTGVAQGKPLPLGAAWSGNRDLMRQIRTGDKDAHGGIVGRALDRMEYSTRERNARRLGISRQDRAIADLADARARAHVQNTAAALRNAEAAWRNAPTVESIDMTQYKNADGSWINAFAEHAYQTQRNAIFAERTRLSNALAAAQANHEAATANAEHLHTAVTRIEDRRNQMQLGPNIEGATVGNRTSNLEVLHDNNNVALDVNGNPVRTNAQGLDVETEYVYERALNNQARRVDDDSYASSRHRGGHRRH